ncbi:MAG: hypothetical protein HeimC2_13170 [Candidatus Heimdallarchaeota archaeon LC_2]|nr:MAG: hypothetical protein HeimC2_13170 [Candidatus Heimdallarchaeota archaeon LC_2]
MKLDDILLTSNINENEEIVKNFVNALNERKFDKAADFVHDEFEFMDEWFEYIEFYKNIAPDPLKINNSKVGWINRHRYNAKSLKGLRRIILKIMSHDNDVWIWSKRRGIHSSDFDGFPATNRELDLNSFVMYEIKNKLIYRAFNMDDDLRGFVQIGKVILEENDKIKIDQYMSKLRQIGLVK